MSQTKRETYSLPSYIEQELNRLQRNQNSFERAIRRATAWGRFKLSIDDRWPELAKRLGWHQEPILLWGDLVDSSGTVRIRMPDEYEIKKAAMNALKDAAAMDDAGKEPTP